MPSSTQKPVSPLNEDQSELDLKANNLNEMSASVSKTNLSIQDKASTAAENSSSNLKKLTLDNLESELSAQPKSVRIWPRSSNQVVALAV